MPCSSEDKTTCRLWKHQFVQSLHFHFVLTGKREEKNSDCLYKKYYHFITFHNNTFSNSFQCPQVILTHRQLSNARVVTAIGRGDQNRKLKCLRFLVVLFSCCSLVIFDYLGVCLPVSFIFKTGSFSRWGINLRNMT